MFIFWLVHIICLVTENADRTRVHCLILTYDMHMCDINIYIQYVIKLIAYQASEMPVCDMFVLYMRTREWPTKPKVHEPKEKLALNKAQYP